MKQTFDVRSFTFPSGCEEYVKVSSGDNIQVSKIKSSADIMKMLLVNDALKRSGIYHIELFIPYLPYARQDRVMTDGESLSVKVMADLINSMGLVKVYVYDCHSDVAPALIKNCVNYNNHEFVSRIINRSDVTIISPDAGAYKKIFKLCQHLNFSGTLSVCNKLRDVATGNLLGVTCDLIDYEGKDCYIIDDICDGGGTFVMLAEELKKRNAGNIYLIVSHGIFSKGVDALNGIEHIYTTDSFCEITHEKLTVLKLEDGLLSK